MSMYDKFIQYRGGKFLWFCIVETVLNWEHNKRSSRGTSHDVNSKDNENEITGCSILFLNIHDVLYLKWRMIVHL